MKINKKFGDKICKKCGTNKPLIEFRKHPPNKLGRSWVDGSCKNCVRKYKRELQAKIRASDLDKSRKQLKNWALIRTYGITVDDYNKMLYEQNGCCAICNKHHTEFKKPLGVDHRHSDGKIRELLCYKCNPGISFFNEDINLLEKVIVYLKKHNYED